MTDSDNNSIFVSFVFASEKSTMKASMLLANSCEKVILSAKSS